MAKHTQAHLTRTLQRNQPWGLKERTKSQMEYYMGAKLIEIGVEPKDAVYRWSLQVKDGEEHWTYSAFWGESKQQLLSGKQPLTGVELIDCARANAGQGVEVAAQLCGYGSNLDGFQEALQQAGEQMGLAIESLGDLLGQHGIEVAPDTPSSL
jgi:hypothetical protein